MKYIKDNIISSSPSIPFVSNPSHETILVNGWEVYIEPEVEETDLEDFRKKKMIVAANSASTERVFRYQLNIDSDCF